MSAPVTEAHRAITESVCELLDSEEMIGPSPVERAAQLIADSEALACAELRALVGTIRSQLNLIPRNVGDITPAEHSHETGAAIDQLRAEVERLKPYVSKAVLTHEGTMLCSPLVAVKFNEQTARAERAEEIADRYGKRAISLEVELAACKESLHLAEGTANLALVHRDAAEAELHALRLVCGTTDADKFSTWVDRANARAEEAEHDCRVLISRLNVAEAELAGIRALADRRNKRDHSQDTTHQLVAALDQALDIAQAELATERARLDWLELRGPWDSWNGFGETGITLRENIRSAIDAAMKEGA